MTEYTRREIQEQLNDSFRELHNYNGIVQNNYNRFKSSGLRKPGEDAFYGLEMLESQRERALFLLEGAENTDYEVIDSEDVSRAVLGLGLEDFPEDYRSYVRDFETGSDSLEESLWTFPLKVAVEDSQKLELKMLSDPQFRDIQRRDEVQEKKERHKELQEELDYTAEKLALSLDVVDEIIGRVDEHNMEAAHDMLLERLSETHHFYQEAIGALRELNQYRRFYGPEEQDASGEPEIGLGAIDSERVDLNISRYIDLTKKFSELELLERDPLDLIDDAEILDE